MSAHIVTTIFSTSRRVFQASDMTSEELIAEIKSQCVAEKGKYDWLDEVIDEIIENAEELITNFPSDDILENVDVMFISDDHHDGYIHELYVTCKNPELNGLGFSLDDLGCGVGNDDGDSFFDAHFSSRPMREIAFEVYSTIKQHMVKW